MKGFGILKLALENSGIGMFSDYFLERFVDCYVKEFEKPSAATGNARQGDIVGMQFLQNCSSFV